MSSPPPNTVITSTPTKYEELNEISYVKQAVIDETKDDVVEENKGEDIQIDLNESIVEITEFSKVVSKHTIAVQRILGDTNDVILYDQVHTKLKSSSNKPTKRDEGNYKDILARLQLSVVQRRIVVTELLRQFENDFYGKHNIVPTNDLQYLKLCRELKYI